MRIQEIVELCNETTALSFRKLALSDKEIFDKFLPYNKERLGWEYSFAMTFIWNAFDKAEVCDLGDMFIIRSKWHGKRIYYQPLLQDLNHLCRAINIIEKECSIEGVPLDVRGLVGVQLPCLERGNYNITGNRDTSDYIYNTDDLITLKGKAFHSKRNFITRFKAAYPDYNFRIYNDALDREKIFALYEKWNTATEHETHDLERIVITRALDFQKELNLKIGVLYVDDCLVAFSISDCNNPNIAHTFFEKADKDYIGSFQAINQFAAEAFLKEHKLVNRQEDLGIEGLRKAKLSYHPVMLVEKYKITHN